MKKQGIDCIFIDRDGTLGQNAEIEYPSDFTPFPAIESLISRLRENGYAVYAFTNQACIARGKDQGHDFANEFRNYGFDDWFICPYDSHDNCACRKPKPGLLEQARAKYNLDLRRAAVIGDRWTDMAAGGQCGCRLILVRTGRGMEALTGDREKWRNDSADHIADNIFDAVDWLCE